MPPAQAILDIDPNAYFLLSGTGQAGRYPGMSWGNGFVTDLNAIKRYNLSDPFFFFRDLSQAPRVLQRTILSPHVLAPGTTVRNPRSRVCIVAASKQMLGVVWKAPTYQKKDGGEWLPYKF